MNSIPTNCGNLDLAGNASKMVNEFVNNHLSAPDSAGITKQHITYFHKKMCNWAYSVPQKFKWVLFIEAISKDSLLSAIKGVTGENYERGWSIADSATSTFADDVQQTIGCIFAQGVNIPGETIKVEHTAIATSNRGFINAPFISGRGDFPTLEVGFMDTNRSFVDGFLRPWSIAVAHAGLLAREPRNSIKANIRVYQLATDNTDQDSRIRKIFEFYDCAPIEIAPDNLNYESSTDFPKIQTKFVFSRYSVRDNTNSSSSFNTPAFEQQRTSPIAIPLPNQTGRPGQTLSS